MARPPARHLSCFPWSTTIRSVKVTEARDQVVELIAHDLATFSAVSLDPTSPDGDAGKFTLNSRTARAIHHFSGWYVPINLTWFSGGFDPPVINEHPFHWYVFAIPFRRPWTRAHYFICDYLQMRDWVLDFTAPLGRDHRDHTNWRADIRLASGDPSETLGYFRWGDEPVDAIPRPSRVFPLDNVRTLAEPAGIVGGQHIGGFGPGGESAAHRLLKLYVAGHPTEFGLSANATPHVEYSFLTGDRVDVLFENHKPDRTVVEVEVAGEQNIVIGVQQAVKYRSLAQVHNRYDLHSARVRSLVVAYDTNYPRAIEIADRYEIGLYSVDRSQVLATA